ncbi:putative nuclease HARBI1 [Carassius carassius]|uniref:putative nuclease HARBI1 n=1 Tax=Carassius carassius TaxID=217509 RepID=UPI002868FD7D|nr:putative nuclease HARBI1 [Carassius carassius]
MQQCSSDDLGLSQPSVSRVITQTITALSEPLIVSEFISFPLDIPTLQAQKTAFMNIAGFPGVVGVIDGTHIRIIAPSEDEDVYVNRKRYHSINVQVVFSADYRIVDIVAKWPGATHDARILAESGLRHLSEGRRIPTNCHLLGDSGYPCKRWLLTPYLHPDQGSQLNYNRAHKKTRAVVEQGIGQLKRRFHILHGEVRLAPGKVCKVITAYKLQTLPRTIGLMNRMMKNTLHKGGICPKVGMLTEPSLLICMSWMVLEQLRWQQKAGNEALRAEGHPSAMSTVPIPLLKALCY